MTLIWTIIDIFLFAEMFFVLLLVLPLANPQKWSRFFKSQLLMTVAKQAALYTYLVITVLVLCLLEAIRVIRKYSASENLDVEQSLDMQMQHTMNLYRAQRNFYICGFAIFLVLVIKRLIHLILEQSRLLAQSEALLKQAHSVSNTVRNRLAVKPLQKEEPAGDQNEITKLKERVHELTSELNREKKDKEALKSQAESLNKEYDRLTEEYSKLQKKITISGGAAKDD